MLCHLLKQTSIVNSRVAATALRGNPHKFLVSYGIRSFSASVQHPEDGASKKNTTSTGGDVENQGLFDVTELNRTLDSPPEATQSTIRLIHRQHPTPSVILSDPTGTSSHLGPNEDGTQLSPIEIDVAETREFLLRPHVPPSTAHGSYTAELEKRESERRKRKSVIDLANQRSQDITMTSMVVNLGLGISKLGVGLSIKSQAMISDAIGALLDMVSDAVVLYSFREARRSAANNPWGRGKYEPLGALGVGMLLFGAGVGLAGTGLMEFLLCFGIDLGAIMSPTTILGAFEQLVNPSDAAAAALAAGGAAATAVENAKVAAEGMMASGIADNLLANHGEGEALLTKTELMCGVGIAGVSIAAKEYLFHKTLSIGKEAMSSAVEANAYQHKSDVNAAIAVAVGLTARYFGFAPADPLAAMCVAYYITKQSFDIIGGAIDELTDMPADEEETNQLRNTCLKIKGVQGVEHLLARKSGPYLFVEATVEVDGSISASAAHRLAELTRAELVSTHSGRVSGAVVHVTPLGSSGLGESYPSWARDHDFIKSEIKRAVLPIAEIHAVTEVQVYYRDNGLIATKVDILLPPHLSIQQAHAIGVRARKAIEIVLPGIGEVDVDLELEEDPTSTTTTTVSGRSV